MPTAITAEFPIPSSPIEFEDLVWHIMRRNWNDPYAKRFGSSGQPQQGVDVYGHDYGNGGILVGVQCKRYEAGKFTRKLMNEEIIKAQKFDPPLSMYVFATTNKRDASIQHEVLLINQEGKAENKFTIDILFWEDLCSLMADPANRDILEKFYGLWPTATIDSDIELIKFYSVCLDRPAFKDVVTPIRNLVPFAEAIKDTLTAINAGLLFDRETRNVIARAKGKSYLTNPNWREALNEIEDHLNFIRKATQPLLVKTDFEPQEEELILFNG